MSRASRREAEKDERAWAGAPGELLLEAAGAQAVARRREAAVVHAHHLELALATHDVLAPLHPHGSSSSSTSAPLRELATPQSALVRRLVWLLLAEQMHARGRTCMATSSCATSTCCRKSLALVNLCSQTVHVHTHVLCTPCSCSITNPSHTSSITSCPASALMPAARRHANRHARRGVFRLVRPHGTSAPPACAEGGKESAALTLQHGQERHAQQLLSLLGRQRAPKGLHVGVALLARALAAGAGAAARRARGGRLAQPRAPPRRRCTLRRAAAREPGRCGRRAGAAVPAHQVLRPHTAAATNSLAFCACVT